MEAQGRPPAPGAVPHRYAVHRRAAILCQQRGSSRKRGNLPKVVKVSREEELLRNAIQLFSHGGFRETSLQAIADELGITRPLFYYYFDSKEDLLWRIIGHLGDALLERARPIATAPGRPTERIARLLAKHIEALIENWDAFRIYYAERHL